MARSAASRPTVVVVSDNPAVKLAIRIEIGRTHARSTVRHRRTISKESAASIVVGCGDEISRETASIQYPQPSPLTGNSSSSSNGSSGSDRLRDTVSGAWLSSASNSSRVPTHKQSGTCADSETPQPNDANIAVQQCAPVVLRHSLKVNMHR